MINQVNPEIVKTNTCDLVHKYHRKSLSWSAIFAGAIVGFVINFLLNLFGVSIALAAFTNTQAGVRAFAIGGFIGLIIVVIVSMFVGGVVSGYLGRPHCVKRNLGILYGFLAFGIAVVFAILIANPMTKYLSHYSNELAGSINAHPVVIANSANASNTVISPQDETVNSSVHDSTNSVDAASTEKNANDIGKINFLIFILFAVGAFSACIGGHFGMRCHCNNEYSEE